MGNRPRKKIVLFLVEGKSDLKALSIAISELYDQIDENIEVYFPIIRNGGIQRGGDITTSRYVDKQGRKHWIRSNNIEEAIYALFLEDFFDKHKILPKDIAEIVHIVDMDGAYIPDENVIEDLSLKEDDSPCYRDREIACLDVECIKLRNNQKRENLDYLCACSNIKIKQKTVPYSVYYFSCNLDHYLHNSANLEYRMKVSLAEDFSKEYIDNVEEFINRISDDPDAIKDMNYEESWEYIKKGTNSLHRHTNLNILLTRLVEKSKQYVLN